MGASDLKLSRAQALALCHTALEAYSAALAYGKARWIEAETAVGMVRDLFVALETRTRVAHLDKRTVLKGKTRMLKIDGKKALAVTDTQRAAVTAFMDKFAAGEPNPEFFRILDVARRIAGTGSLGVDRYVILVEGKGSPDGNYLIDLKEALPSSVTPHVRTPQADWQSEAQRVVEVQRRNQAVSQAFLHAVDFNQRSYVLRSLQPSEDRVALADWNGNLPRLEQVVNSMAELSAWAHLRSGGRQKSSIADDLIAFGNRQDWQMPLVNVAMQCEAQVAQDWKAYCDAYDAGTFDPAHVPPGASGHASGHASGAPDKP